MPENHKKVTVRLEGHRDLKDLVDYFKSGKVIKKIEYKGEDEIFNALKIINDLVRLCKIVQEEKILEIEFPFKEFKNSNQLPVIEIEFASLKEHGQANGNLILLDTPGPNESGQEHLRPMVQEQLKRASAIIMVIDYTQLKSEATNQIKDELMKMVDDFDNRIYILVNKFDQTDSKSMDEEAVKTFIHTETKNRIPRERVFPVSSQKGYLSNHAKRVLSESANLNTLESQLEDFFNLNENITASMKSLYLAHPFLMQELVEETWAASKLSKPLAQIIQAGYERATLIMLQSIAVRCCTNAHDISNYLEIYDSGLKHSAEELRKLIQDTREDIVAIEKCEEEALHLLDTILENLNITLRNKIYGLHEELKDHLKSYFQIGKAKTQEILSKEDKLRKKEAGYASRIGEKLRYELKKQRSLRKSASNRPVEKSSVNDHSLSAMELVGENKIEDGIIEFSSDVGQAQIFVGNLLSDIDATITAANKLLLELVIESTEAIEEEFQKEIMKWAEDFLADFEKKLNRTGLSGISISMPKIDKIDFNLDLKLSNDTILEKQVVEKTRVENLDYFGSTITRFFGGLFDTDWGKEVHRYNSDTYRVDLKKIEAQVMENINSFPIDAARIIEECVRKPISNTSAKFFDEFMERIEEIRQELNNAIEISSQDQSEQEKFIERIEALKKDFGTTTWRADNLNKALIEN